MADKKELTDASAAVSGSAIISSPTAIAIASSASPSSFAAAAAAAVPATSRYISDRKWSSDQIGSSYEYDDSASGVSASASTSTSTSDCDTHFAMLFAELKEDNNNNTTNDDNDDDRKLRSVLDTIDSRHKPGWKFSTILLNQSRYSHDGSLLEVRTYGCKYVTMLLYSV